MFADTILELLDKALQERKDLFLIDFSVAADNAIKIVIDGDKGVLVEDCVFISRAIEHNLDRETEDFSLEVTSAGATSPLVNNRQYKKNSGRTLKIVTHNQTLEGKLTNVKPEGIEIEWKTREPKPIGKGKVTVKKQMFIPFSDIQEAKVLIKF
ncbi:MAG TPA: ribosome assembly cofactor RimP [Flavobacteriaceae bacterium]|nr:ribosome assembly cofactor RimP [Flavobacteriaceae bacterium]